MPFSTIFQIISWVSVLLHVCSGADLQGWLKLKRLMPLSTIYISAISWWSVLLMEETRVPVKIEQLGLVHRYNTFVYFTLLLKIYEAVIVYCLYINF